MIGKKRKPVETDLSQVVDSSHLVSKKFHRLLRTLYIFFVFTCVLAVLAIEEPLWGFNIMHLLYFGLGNLYLGLKAIRWVKNTSTPRLLFYSFIIQFVLTSLAIYYPVETAKMLINVLFMMFGSGFFLVLIIDRILHLPREVKKAQVVFLGKNLQPIFRIILQVLSIIVLTLEAFSLVFMRSLPTIWKIQKKLAEGFLYVLVGGFVIFVAFVCMDYLRTQYGWQGKIFCSFGVQDEVQQKIVRIVGGYSEGSGFFITPNQILTNFHVIADEPSPKIIFADGSFVTPSSIIGDSEKDLAVLQIGESFPDFVFPLPDYVSLQNDEPLIAAGYPLGTDLVGKATLMKGRFVDYRRTKKSTVSYLQTNISLAEGMSGGPLVDACGNVVGVNTLGLAGLSLYIDANSARSSISQLTDQNITKVALDYTSSPDKAVESFYLLLKTRRMEEGFRLLSIDYLKKTDFTEWTNRFVDILDVNIMESKMVEGSTDTVFVKFGTKNWNDGEVDYHYYEGTWQTVMEDGVYRMLKSHILEVDDPSWDWFY